MLEETSPTLLEQREKTLVQLNIVGIAFPLIPRDTLNPIAIKRHNTHLEHITRLIGMTLKGIRRFRDVFQSTTTSPRLAEVAMIPIVKNAWELIFQCRAVNPRLRRRAAHRIADDTNRNLQTVSQHTTEMKSDGREVLRILR